MKKMQLKKKGFFCSFSKRKTEIYYRIHTFWVKIQMKFKYEILHEILGGILHYDLDSQQNSFTKWNTNFFSTIIFSLPHS